MDPVALIVAALAAGTSLGVKDVTSATVLDTYAGLRALVRKRLSGRPDGAMVLSRHAESPHTWEAPLTAELTAAGAAGDEALVAAATALLRLADEAGFRAGKYAVDARGAAGVQAGDHNTQHNTFDGPPGH
jgi:hypothetical protein